MVNGGHRIRLGHTEMDDHVLKDATCRAAEKPLGAGLPGISSALALACALTVGGLM
jgi:hypothetical protein